MVRHGGPGGQRDPGPLVDTETVVRVERLHSWRVSYVEALAIQRTLRQRVRLQPLTRPVRLVAGSDVAYSRRTHRMYASVVVVSLPGLEIVDIAEAVRPATFPYIPGLFTFRELPPLVDAFERLRQDPDVVIFDGHGLAHPRRFGLACHAGLLLGRPSVGCAKSILVGRHGPLASRRGATSLLVDNGETVGAAVRTRDGVAPLYVSAGHLVDLQSAVALVLETVRRFRIPEPIRHAHRATMALRRRMDPGAPAPAERDYPDFLRT